MAVIDSYDTSGSVFPVNSTTPKLGQSFTGNGATLGSAVFALSRVGSPPGDAVVEIFAHSGTFGTSSIGTGSALATSDALSAGTIPASETLTEYFFGGGNRITLDNGIKYVAVVSYSAGDASNYIDLGYSFSSPTHPGNLAYITSETWTPASNSDCKFYIYDIPPPPSVDADYSNFPKFNLRRT